MANAKGMAILAIVTLISPMLLPFTSADEGFSMPEINARWIADESGENGHAYRVTFADAAAYQASIDVQHLRSGDDLAAEIFQSWDLIDGTRILDIQLNTSMEWDDVIRVELTITHRDGVELAEPAIVDREFLVGTWNQPMACLLYTSPSPRDE